MLDKPFYFQTKLRVTLQDGSTAFLQRQIRVDAADAVQAREGLRAVATEACHDAGSKWFDAPVEEVEVQSAVLVDAWRV